MDMDKDRILIFDFSSDSDSTIVSTLENASYEVDIITNYLDGLCSIGGSDYKLVIIKDGPIGIGWLVCYQVRQLTNIPSIVISSDLSLETLVRTLNSGADYFLTEPLDYSELIARIDALLRRKKLDKELSLRRARLVALSRLN